jgi:hypothetical protein
MFSKMAVCPSSFSHYSEIAAITGPLMTMYPCSSLYSASAFTSLASKLVISNRVLVSMISTPLRTISLTDASFSVISLHFANIVFACVMKASLTTTSF